MLRRTKIVVTLGPATDDPKVLEDLIRGGIDMARLNFSHGTPEEQAQRARTVRALAQKHGRDVAILADLQGPKIRLERFKEGRVNLDEGARFVLDASLGTDEGDEQQVGITYKDLPRDVSGGDVLLLDDGQIQLRVERVEGNRIESTVLVGGELSNNKGINRQGGGLTVPALTDKDREDMKTAAEIDADYLGISFPRHARDIEESRELFYQAGGRGGIMAKIERAESLDVIDEIIVASDSIMIARGDLGVEIGDAELPAVQKHLIRRARELNRTTVTATQMMQSMIESEMPTRAEVFDVANAVLDGTDAVMLSAESATGQHPAKVVAAMDRICRGAERHPVAVTSSHRLDTRFERIDEAIAMATMYTANHLGVKAIVALTESGATPQWMSRIRSGIPIYALTRHEATRRRVALFRNVCPVAFECESKDHAEVNRQVIAELLERGVVKNGEVVIITKGDLMGVRGGTNAMKIIRVGDTLSPDDGSA